MNIAGEWLIPCLLALSLVDIINDPVRMVYRDRIQMFGVEMNIIVTNMSVLLSFEEFR
jgi:hypothetical protein